MCFCQKRNEEGDFLRYSSSKPTISSYDFMRLLCATLASQKKMIIDLRSLVTKIYDFKISQGNNVQFLFEDIEFRDSIDCVVSYDISESINNLQTFGVIGKLNPTYEKIIIYLTSIDIEHILSDYDENIRNHISNLADTF